MSESDHHPPDLIASCWTSAGDAAPLRGTEISPVDIRTRVEAAAAAGWKGFGLVHADLVQIRDTVGFAALRQIFDDNGIEHVELEYLSDWWTSGAVRDAADRYRDDLLSAAGPLGARHIKVGAGLKGDPVESDRLRDGWDLLAERARGHGVRLALEPAPYSYLPTVQSAVSLVTEVAHPHGGLLVDVWHTFRGGTTDHAELVGLVPPQFLFAVEIDDGLRNVVGTLFEDTINNREYCGEGDFGVPAFIRAVQALGFEGPWGVEIISEAHRHRPVEQGLALAHKAAVHCFRLANQDV